MAGPTAAAGQQNAQVKQASPRSSQLGTRPTEVEEILFANFLSDYDPSLIFLVTYCPDRNVSYLKVLKIRN